MANLYELAEGCRGASPEAKINLNVDDYLELLKLNEAAGVADMPQLPQGQEVIAISCNKLCEICAKAAGDDADYEQQTAVIPRHAITSAPDGPSPESVVEPQADTSKTQDANANDAAKPEGKEGEKPHEVVNRRRGNK